MNNNKYIIACVGMGLMFLLANKYYETATSGVHKDTTFVVLGIILFIASAVVSVLYVYYRQKRYKIDAKQSEMSVELQTQGFLSNEKTKNIVLDLIASNDETNELKTSGELVFDPARIHMPMRAGDLVRLSSEHKGVKTILLGKIVLIDGYNRKTKLHYIGIAQPKGSSRT